MLHRISIASLMVLIISLYAYCEDHWGAQTENWTLANSPHHVTDNCEINSPYEITIEAGCEVYFDGFYEIRVNAGGTLLVPGTTANPVLFTANQGAQPGTWRALIADGTSGNPATMTLTNCEIRYGGEHETDVRHASGVVRCDHYGHAIITDCYIHHNWGEGVGTDHNGANNNHLELAGCRIENCEIGVKLVLPDEDTVVKRNWIESCVLGMRLDTDPEVGGKVVNNIIKSSQANGVEDLPGYASWISHFKNNVIDGSGGSGMYLSYNIYTDAVQNNVFLNSARYGIEALGTHNSPVSHNCFYHNTIDKYTPNVRSYPEITANPAFAADFGDQNYYHLQWDSPCLGSGTGTNCNPAISTADIGAYGGPELDPGLSLGLYWVVIAGGDVYGTLNQDASPFHVLREFEIPPPPPARSLEITAQGSDCELYFHGEIQEPAGITAWQNLTVTGDGSHIVSFNLLNGSTAAWYGILLGVGGLNNTHSLQYADISGADNGLLATSCILSLDHCNIHDCDYTGIFGDDFAQISVSNSVIANNGASGLFIWPNSKAYAFRNTISNNGKYGVCASDYSSFIADYTIDAGIPVNYIFGNGYVNPELYHQIDLFKGSRALMKEGHNQITSSADKLVQATHNYAANPVQYNWWGESNPDPSRFDPPGAWDVFPCDENPWEEDSGERSSAELAFENAVALDQSGEYLSAETAYRYVVANYPTDALATEALSRTLFCALRGGGNFDNQVTYYQSLSDTCSVVALAELANELVWRSLVELEQFQQALDRCEAVISNPPSLEDSMLAVVDAGFTYLAAEAHGHGLDALGPIGIYPELKPASYKDYLLRLGQLLAILETHRENVLKEQWAAMPSGFALSNPYPNPFNASTRISYKLLDTRNVKLMVYDVLGRKVANLVDDRQKAGDYNVIWSGTSSSGIPVSSGVYFVWMSTETGVQSAKMLLLK